MIAVVLLSYTDCSEGYFTSKNCMRELHASAYKKKAVIALVDPDASRGGLNLEEVWAQLVAADNVYEQWGLDKNRLRSLELYAHLTASEPIEWNRIGHFQDVVREHSNG